MAKPAYRVISADSHTVEPPDLWEQWLEKKYLDTAPKLVEDKDGGHAWLYMGATTPSRSAWSPASGPIPRSSSGRARATASPRPPVRARSTPAAIAARSGSR